LPKFAAKDVNEFRFCGHALKSSSHNIGAVHLTEIGDRLEKITEGDFHSSAPQHILKIEDEIGRVHEALDRECSKLAA
jgi:two-component system, sensor histidine kinase RpfC